jgi:hypothetical protein
MNKVLGYIKNLLLLLPDGDQQIEEILKGDKPQKDLSLQDQVFGLETAIKVLNPSVASKISMLSTLYKKLGLETSYLPKYTDENLTYSLTHLLKKFKVGISAKDMNLVLLEKGVLELLQRPSQNTDKVKTFKSLTEMGLKFGKNLISPHNERETTPHYYENRFSELLEVISE